MEHSGNPSPASRHASGPQAPVREPERLEILDVLRGLAIFGILLVNVRFFVSPIFLPGADQDWWPAPLDRAVEYFVTFVAQGKFYALFSFLFGTGLAIQMERAAARGAPVAGFFARRMGWLALIGLAHGLLLWYGDILFLYSLLGFVLLLFRNRRPRTLWVWTAILLIVPVVLHVAFVGLVAIARMFPEAAEQLAQLGARNSKMAEAAREAYSSGSFGEILTMRFTEWRTMIVFGLFLVGAQILALFLIGLNLGRTRVWHSLPDHLPAVKRWMIRLLPVGVVGGLLQVVGLLAENPAIPSPWTLASTAGQVWGAPAMAGFYVCAVVLLLQRPAVRPWLTPLGFVGRMALSNYLLHTVVFTTLAYSYGFGLYGRITPAQGLGLTLAVYLAQIPLSRWWLARFRFGPLEWLWRSLTYWQRQPFRRAG